MNPALRTLGLTFGIALAYALSGRLGALLAIPPGYATAIFPPAGLALAVLVIYGWRALPGIFLGSVFFNSWNAWLYDQTFSNTDHLLSLVIAGGSSLQAALSFSLLRRFIGLPLLLDDGGKLLRFMLLSCLLATVIGASVGAGSLFLAGRIAAENISTTWLTWWVGDGIGVMVIAPLVVMALGEPRAYWRPLLKQVAPAMLMSLILVIGAFFTASRWESDRLNSEFERRAHAVSNRMQDHFASALTQLTSLERFFAASQKVERDEFHDFVHAQITANRAIDALAWVPIVPNTERAAHEALWRDAAAKNYYLWDRDAGGERPPASERPWYAPITLTEPMAHMGPVLGFDLASREHRRQAIEKAIASGKLTLSALSMPDGDRQGLAAVYAMLAVQRGSDKRGAVDLVTAALNIAATVEQSLQAEDRAAMVIRIDDPTAPEDRRVLYRSPTAEIFGEQFRWQTQWTLGDRTWQVSFAASPAFAASQRSWSAWLVLVAGLLFTAMMGALMLLGASHTRNIQAEVEQRTRELRRSERLQRAISDAALDGIVLLDDAGHVLSANPAALQLFAATPDAILGEPLARWITDPQLEKWRHAADDESLRQEAQIDDNNGQSFAVELTFTAVEFGDYHGVSVQLRDLRERDQVARMKTEFISVVSHELRTPLTSLRGAVKLLAGGATGALTPAVKELVDLASRNAERLAVLINDLLDFEKLELGNLPVTLLRQPILPVLEQAVQEISTYALQQSVHVRLQVPASLPEVDFAADRLAQVLANLLSNAIKFSPQGGQVSVVTLCGAKAIRVGISDQGPGIPEAVQARVFSKFWQADSSSGRKHGGTGLGLAITKQLVERMGGDIGFETSPRGSTFYFVLPLPKD